MTLVPLNDAIRLGPEYQEPARDQRAWLVDGTEVVMQCALSRTAVLRRVDDVTSRWLELLDAVLVDPDALQWQPMAAVDSRKAAARGRAHQTGKMRTASPRSRNLRICRGCGRDSFQVKMRPSANHGGLCVECEAARQRAREASA